MKVIKKIGVFSFAKFQAIFGILFGLIIGIIFALISFLIPSTSGTTGVSSPAASIFGIGSIIILPLFYGFFGFIGGIITAFISNFVLKITGGLKVTIEDVPEHAEPTV
jgi:hypothetical protein